MSDVVNRLLVGRPGGRISGLRNEELDKVYEREGGGVKVKWS
ncbi:hypothetical protein [Staphylococcus capitis]|nr:hypothetical protein [Staphylococcus capitis]